MLSGLQGTLLSHYFAEKRLRDDFAGRLGESTCRSAHSALALWWRQHARQLGPASGMRAVWEICAAPLAELLGFAAGSPTTHRDIQIAILQPQRTRAALLATLWSASLDDVWRDAMRAALAEGVDWALCTNGRQLRLVRASRSYSRAHVEFDLERVADSEPAFDVMWALLRRQAFEDEDGTGTSLLVQLLDASAAHGVAVSRSLRLGVLEAVGHLLNGLDRCRSSGGLDELLHEALTIVYRVLFLMFAEARSLVPVWHPVYRDAYTVESLRDQVERIGPCRGVWEALQAISRLAHKGCALGTLAVPAFNGRLFSPSASPLAESCSLDDDTARSALSALSTARDSRRRVRIDYRDLGVEQLGSVYETILDYAPTRAPAPSNALVLERGGGARKASGSFYTPQPMTDYVVRRTLHPLVDTASAPQILQLRIVDPAMGSGAFLVSACHYLARSYERALIRDGDAHESELTERDRAEFRRAIAQRCLFGVDLNPTAVQLARLSLWLATLAAEKPLTFLDHRLVCGNSILGATPEDVMRQPPSARRWPNRNGRGAPLLFADDDFERSQARAVVERRWLADTPDETAAIVHEKERRLIRLKSRGRWKRIADLWCACWMWPDRDAAPGPAVFSALVDRETMADCQLPEQISGPLVARADALVQQERFFHWTSEFPEVFYGESGERLADGGFDAVLGNPPWDMLPRDRLDGRFVRGSGIYRHQGSGRINRYQLFVERAVQLVRPAGRIGLVLPGGFATDHSAAELRRVLLDRTTIDAITGFDNRRAIFPIHRSVRFVALTATAAGSTSRLMCRFGLDALDELEKIPDKGDRADDPSHPIALTRSFIGLLSAERLAFPDLRSPVDLQILERIVHTIPMASHASGWNVRFGRELNATDDQAYFRAKPTGLPVLEGKHIEPFRVHTARATRWIDQAEAARLLDAAATFGRPRIAYRDVASPTNRLSLIAAILPAGVVSTHSLFCLKTMLPLREQAVLCALMNSYIANYLVRQVLTTHLGSASIEALRIPKPAAGSAMFERLYRASMRLARHDSPRERLRVQGLAARCYGLRKEEFAHVLSTFPLVPPEERDGAIDAFARSERTYWPDTGNRRV